MPEWSVVFLAVLVSGPFRHNKSLAGRVRMTTPEPTDEKT